MLLRPSSWYMRPDGASVSVPEIIATIVMAIIVFILLYCEHRKELKDKAKQAQKDSDTTEHDPSIICGKWIRRENGCTYYYILTSHGAFETNEVFTIRESSGPDRVLDGPVHRGEEYTFYKYGMVVCYLDGGYEMFYPTITGSRMTITYPCGRQLHYTKSHVC